MENKQTTRKWSEVHGIAVVSLANGKKIGTCDDFYFEPTTQRIHALRIKTGMFGHKVLPATTVQAIGADAITTTNEERLQKESEDEVLGSCISAESLGTPRVMSASGTLVGTVGSLLLDTSTPADLHLAAFELAGGFRDHLTGRRPTFSAAQVARYGQDVLIIPDEVAQSLHT